MFKYETHAEEGNNMVRLLIIADDLTGAMDTGVQFAVFGAEILAVTDIEYDFEKMDEKVQILVIDAETRHLKPIEAYRIVFEITKRACNAGIPYIYKKTDSALRGNVGSELTAVLDASGQKNLNFIPAFPKLNRVTKDGIHYIDGVPVHQSVFGMDPYEPVVCSYIPDIIGKQSEVKVRVVNEADVQADTKELLITVYNANNDQEIKSIAEKLYESNQLKIMAGCAGFAAYLPDILKLKGNKRKIPELPNCFLVICGSVNPITRKQLDYAEQRGFTRIRLGPEQKLEKGYYQSTEGKKFLQNLIIICKNEKYCIIDTNDFPEQNDTFKYANAKHIPLEDIRVSISTTLGYIVKEVIASGIESALLITGGDSLLGCMKRVQCHEIAPICELAPGTVLSQIEVEKKQYNLISKSGGFGEENLIVDIAKAILHKKEEKLIMLKNYMLKMPHVVYSGKDALENLKSILAKDVKRAAVFSDKGIVSTGMLDLPMKIIRETGVEMVIFDELPSEPTCDQAQKVINQFKASGADFIIAVGGGSVMDIAKLASVLATDSYSVRDLLDNPALANKCVKTLMIPTTAGTGAEATPNSIVTVPEKELKVGIVNEAMIADYVILDAVMMKKLPRKIAASTGVDALAHAIECFTSNKANPFSDIFALEALDLIFNNIESACDDPEAMEAKEAMLIASFYAGVAITASGTTAVHALSYPLGGKYHIPHGIANAIMLTPVMKFNEVLCQDKFAQAYDRIVKVGAEGKTVQEKSAWIINRLDEIVTHLDIPKSLKEYGIGSENLETLVKSGMEVKRLLVNNIREVKEEDARALYLEIM